MRTSPLSLGNIILKENGGMRVLIALEGRPEVPKQQEEINGKWQTSCLELTNVFLVEMFFKLCICFRICLSSKWFHPRLTFFLFSNLGLVMAQQTSIPINCFMAGGEVW